jgi:hypothetical protein
MYSRSPSRQPYSLERFLLAGMMSLTDPRLERQLLLDSVGHDHGHASDCLTVVLLMQSPEEHLVQFHLH